MDMDMDLEEQKTRKDAKPRAKRITRKGTAADKHNSLIIENS